jgi:hypothetical protein
VVTLPLVGGCGTGQTGVVTFPSTGARDASPDTAGFGPAAEMVTAEAKNTAMATKRKLNTEDEFIVTCPFGVKDRNEKSTPEASGPLLQK